jgi:hypothetical protein
MAGQLHPHPDPLPSRERAKELPTPFPEEPLIYPALYWNLISDGILTDVKHLK